MALFLVYLFVGLFLICLGLAVWAYRTAPVVGHNTGEQDDSIQDTVFIWAVVLTIVFGAAYVGAQLSYLGIVS